MKLISSRCEVCGTKLRRRARACQGCEQARRHASLLELYSRLDDQQAAERRAEWMAGAIDRVTGSAGDATLATQIEASLRAKLTAATAAA